MGFIDPAHNRPRARAGIAVLILVTLAVVGCASSATHPGAANSTDSQLYDSLVSVQAAIEQARAEFSADPAAKAPLNRVIAAYNAAQDAYRSYRELAVSGHAPDAATLTAQISVIVRDLADLRAQFGKKKGGAL